MSEAARYSNSFETHFLKLARRLLAQLGPVSEPDAAIQLTLRELESATGLKLVGLENPDETVFRPTPDLQLEPEIQALLELGEQILHYRLQELRTQKQMQAVLKLSAQTEPWEDPLAILEQVGKILLEATGFEVCLLHQPHPGIPGAFRLAKVLAGSVPPEALERLQSDHDFAGSPGLVGESLRQKTALYYEDYSRYPDPYPGYLELGLRSVAIVPFAQGDQVAGLIELQSYHRAPTHNPMPFLQTVSHHLEAVLNRIAQSETLLSSAQTYRELAEFSARLEAIHDPEALISEAFATLLHLTGFNSVDYLLILPDKSAKLHRSLALAGSPESRPELAEFLARPFNTGTGATGEALEQLKTIFYPDYAKFPGAMPEYIELGLTSIATSPVVAGGKAVALLQIRHYGPEHQPDPSPLLSFVATRLSNALDQQMAMEDLAREAERFATLAELSSKIENLESPREIAAEAIETLLQLTPFESGAYFEAGPGGEWFRMTEARGSAPSKAIEVLSNWAAPRRDILFSDTLGPGRVGWIADYASEGISPLRETGLQSLAAIPLYAHGQLLGELSLTSFSEKVAPQTVTENLLRSVAGRLERALERAFDIQDIRDTREESLRLLGIALELRDLETAGHTNRVTEMALNIGVKVMNSSRDLEQLRWGAYLHDTGKMAISDSILLKPGRLTPEEFRVMQTHAAIGEEMLRPLRFLPSATLQVVRHHHERWDGSGYPDGLAGEDIPLLARIFTLADVYDALTHTRPYKSAWSPEAARAEIASQAGKQFDPELAKIFLETVLPKP